MTKRFKARPGAGKNGVMTPDDLRMEESETQTQVMRWLELKHPRAFEVTHHSPNGELRDDITAQKLKRMGTKPGFPDLVIFQPAEGYTGLVMEIKERGGRLTREQIWWLNHFELLRYYVCRPVGFDQCVNHAERYLSMVTWS